jgi:hypothetical protein
MSNLDRVETEAKERWAWFRGWIRKHPLSGVWVGVAAGAVIVAPILSWIF